MPRPRERKKSGLYAFHTAKGLDAIESINWAEFDKKLPSDRGGQSRKQRVEIFKSWNKSRNGYLSIDEVEAGLKLTFCYGNGVRAAVAPSIRRAFRGAKDVTKGKGIGLQKGYIEKNQFRIFCEFLRYDLYIMMHFQGMGALGAEEVSEKEFVEFFRTCNVPGLLPNFSGSDDLKTQFALIDINEIGSIRFDEFAEYMINLKVQNPSPLNAESVLREDIEKLSTRSSTPRSYTSPRSKETGKDTKRRIPSKGRGGGYALSPSEGVIDNPNSNTIASTSNIENALLLKLEEKIMKQVDKNHRQVMGKLSNIENLLRSSNMLGAPTINQKVKSLIGQVATLTQAMNDVTLLLEDKNGGLGSLDEDFKAAAAECRNDRVDSEGTITFGPPDDDAPKSLQPDDSLAT